MKKFIVIAALLGNLIVMAQAPANIVKGELVKVKDWGSRSILLGRGFFDETRDSIISQVGQEEFVQIMQKSSESGWPQGLYHSGLSEEEDKAFDTSLNRLKMYRIASFTHIYNGKVFDRYVILRVPGEENGNWNKSVQWEGNVYFLLKEKDIEQE